MKDNNRINRLGFALVSCIAPVVASFAAGGEWISVPDAPVYVGPVTGNARAADGTSWFARTFKNSGDVASAKWTVSGLGVFEVFVNGAYGGVWESVPRLTDVVAAWASPVYKVRTPDGLWDRASSEMLERRDAAAAGEDPYAPFLELARFVVGAPAADFAARVADFFDLDGLADMYLLLNFTGNADGRITNQYVVRRRADGRWFALPWDYDKTFLGGKGRDAALSNRLYDRCRRGVPGFLGRLSSRWAAQRAGPLSDEALERWIDERADFLAPFMEEDFRLVRPDDAGPDAYPRLVEEFRAQVRYRVRRLDDRLSR